MLLGRRNRHGVPPTLLAGIVAALAGIRTVTWTVAALTAASGLWATMRMYEIHTHYAVTGRDIR